MVKMTLIARVADALLLAEFPDSDMHKQHVQSLFKNLSRGDGEASRMSVETGPLCLIEHVFFICLAKAVLVGSWNTRISMYIYQSH